MWTNEFWTQDFWTDDWWPEGPSLAPPAARPGVQVGGKRRRVNPLVARVAAEMAWRRQLLLKRDREGSAREWLRGALAAERTTSEAGAIRQRRAAMAALLAEL